MKLIELKGVEKKYRTGSLFGKKQEAKVLRGVNLVIESGCCTGLLGASGCGKSTSGRLILGLERPDGGEILYKGINLWKLRGSGRYSERCAFRRNCQVVFQNSAGAVNPRFRAWEIITEALLTFEKLSRKQLRTRAASLIEQAGLSPSDIDKLPGQFSGGELQRVCIARALALSPEFILLDEAVSALDMLNQSLILDLLIELKQRTGTAFLFISHDLRVLLKICDRLAIMDKGQITGYIEDMNTLESPDFAYDPVFKSLAQAVLPAEPVDRNIRKQNDGP